MRKALSKVKYWWRNNRPKLPHELKIERLQAQLYIMKESNKAYLAIINQLSAQLHGEFK